MEPNTSRCSRHHRHLIPCITWPYHRQPLLIALSRRAHITSSNTVTCITAITRTSISCKLSMCCRNSRCRQQTAPQPLRPRRPTHHRPTTTKCLIYRRVAPSRPITPALPRLQPWSVPCSPLSTTVCTFRDKPVFRPRTVPKVLKNSAQVIPLCLRQTWR